MRQPIEPWHSEWNDFHEFLAPVPPFHRSVERDGTVRQRRTSNPRRIDTSCRSTLPERCPERETESLFQGDRSFHSIS
jgi:hypothetical protein